MNRDLYLGTACTDVALRGFSRFKSLLFRFLVGYLVLLSLVPVSAQIDAPKRDTLFYDANGNVLANPSDSVRYILILKNDGTNQATMISVPNGTDPNTNLNPSSILTSPLAVNDGPYPVTGNMGISVPAGSGVSVNDFDDNTAALTINGAGMSMATAQGGSITISPDGSFTYSPPPGFTGRDSALYTVIDGTPAPNCPTTNDAWVFFEITDMIWFVNENASGGGNNGTLSDPFETLAAFEAVNGNGGPTDPAANQPIFIYSSATFYTGGVTLENGQQLLGQGMTTSVSVATGITLPMFSLSFPTVNMTNPILVNTGGNAITLASGNDIRGLDVGTAMTASNGSGIVGMNVGDLMISEDVNVYTGGGSAGPGVSILTGGTLAVALGNVNVSGSSTNGINVSNISGGTFDVASANVTNSTGTGINITTSMATFDFTSMSITTNTAVANGFNMSGGGTITVGGGSLSVMSANALSINGSTIGMTGVTFASISANGAMNSPDQTAISLTNTGSGPFTSNGGIIQNILNADAIRFNNTGGALTLNNMTMQNISATGDAGAAIGTRSGIDGIHGQNVLGGLTLDGVTMQRFSDNAINGALFTNGLDPTNWNGLVLNNCSISYSNRYDPALVGVGDDNSEGMVRINGLYGTVTVTGSTFADGAQFLELYTHASNTLDMTVQGSSFTRTLKEFVCAGDGGTTNVGKRGITVEVRGTANAVVRIGDPAEVNNMLGNTFTDNGTASVVVYHATGATGDVDVVISQNDFIVTDHLTGPNTCPGGSFAFNFPQGGVSLNPGGGTFEAILSNNLFDEVMHAAGGLGQFTMTADEGGSSEFIVTGNTFSLPWDAPVRVLADGNGTCAMLFEDNIYNDGMVGGAGDDLGMPFPSPYQGFLVNVRNNGSLDLQLNNEDLPIPDPSGPRESSFDVEVQASGGSLNLYLQNNTAPADFTLEQGGGTFLLFDEASCLMGTTPTDVIANNSNTGTVNASGTITCTSTAPMDPMITIPFLASTMGVDVKPGEISTTRLAAIQEQTFRILSSVTTLDQQLKLDKINIVLTDLPGRELASYFAGVIRIDRDAAGHGWCDTTKPDISKQASCAGMDLLTVLIHEYLHALDLPHTPSGIMSSELKPGTKWSLDLLPQNLTKE